MSPLVTLRAAVAVVAAAAVVDREYPGRSLAEVVEHLRAAPQLPRQVRDPVLLRRLVVLLAPVLPPWGMGRCLKRSLVLLRLWSGCGVAARLHLGVGEHRTAHAWLTADDPPLAAGCGDGFLETAVL